MTSTAACQAVRGGDVDQVAMQGGRRGQEWMTLFGAVCGGPPVAVA
jgi:hypothetical protein